MQTQSDESDELLRRRQRNRVAQQKYRKRLKSHIQNLEKRAAVADRLCQDGAQLPADATPPYDHQFPNQQMGDQNATIPTALNMGQNRYKASSGSNGSGDSPVPQHSRAMSVNRRDSLLDEIDFLKAFSLPNDDLCTQKIRGFNDLAILDTQEDNGESLEALRFMAGSQELDEVFNPPKSSASRSSQLDFTPKSALDVAAMPDLPSLESRVDFILRSIQSMGFETPDSFMLSYYTGSFDERSAAKVAQDASRSTGLPRMLHELRSKTEDWSRWESRSYADSVVRSAAKLIAEEFDSLSRKRYACERELQKGLASGATSQAQGNSSSSTDGNASVSQLYSAAAELKKTLRDELPNLHALVAKLSSEESAVEQASRVQLLLATIKLIATTADEPLKEAASWMYSRTSS